MSKSKIPEIENPRRVLAVSLESSSHHLGRVVKDLSGTHPTPSPTLSGITHPLPLDTPYYTTTLPLWLDLIAEPQDWAETFLSPEAREVLDALGGLLLVFEIPRGVGAKGEGEEALIREVGRVVKDGLGGWGWDGVAVAVGLGGSDVDGVWEDRCANAGLELIVVGEKDAEGARNEFGEKVGIARALEALQANDWSSLPEPSSDDDPDAQKGDFDLDLALDGDDFDFGLYGDRSDFEGLRAAILEASLEREGVDVSALDKGRPPGDEADGEKSGQEGEGPEREDEELGDEDVRKLEGMMSRLRAVREMGEGMPEEERRRMARRAVGEVMKEL